MFFQQQTARPFGIFSLSVRYNCPWHRKNFTPSFFPFMMKRKVERQTAEARSKTRGGRLMLMGRILREKHFLAWITKPTPNERVSNPL
ncbi:unnamed protein product [Dracunculus medinensis]|uniref:Uncharacterized protein n=1 Tax=Dracunculus medinensis TaxID=318479 RepID=A0A0N4U5J2_DRAME|nr:unnamed protein product [Dracunculus medinensis]